MKLVDPTSGKVTGRICHIKARQPGGPRYDTSQTEEQRHAFENLVLMCPIHHDVIDDDTDSYTVDRLLQIKKDHESSRPAGTAPSDSVAAQLIANIDGNNVSHGSIIFSQNQMGGQIAHSIQNFGLQPRQIQQAAANALIAELRKHSPETIDLTCVMGDTESYELASNIKQMLDLCGWKVNGVNQAIFMAPITGTHIETPTVCKSLDVLLNWMGSVGLKPQGRHMPDSQTIRVIIGANL